MTTAAANPMTATVDRFFTVSLYLMLVVGFTTLASTGELDLVSIAIGSAALALRGYLLYRERVFLINEAWSTGLTILYVLFYGVDLFFLSGGARDGFVTATVHLVLFGMVVKLFSVQRFRDHIYLAILAFLMVLAAAVWTVDSIFLLAFAIFLMLGVATFASLEMKRALAGAQRIVSTPGRLDRGVVRSLAGTSAGVMGMIILGGAVVFFLLPRLSAGYLSAFAPKNELVSGFSHDVELGAIGQIQQSSSTIMHVQVQRGSAPADLKWRGLALSTFSGTRWSNPPDTLLLLDNRNGFRLAGLRLSGGGEEIFPASGASTLAYRVVMEPIGTQIFFVAPTPLRLQGNYNLVGVDAGGSITNADRMRAINTYQAESRMFALDEALRTSTRADYPTALARKYLQLPRLDPRIQALAEQVTRPANSPYERALRLEHHLRVNYGYTLQLLDQPVGDPLAHFLFARKVGHCEYFASAMAVMLRTVGIPSRIVNGFRNGEYNDLTGSHIVRARDAHAWVEAYFPGHGWVSFDPTPADPMGERRLSRLALYMDAMREFWREWVINYDFSHQAALGSTLNAQRKRVTFSSRVWLREKYTRMVAALKSLKRRIDESENSFWYRLGGAGLAILLLGALPFAIRWLRQHRVARRPGLAPERAASIWYLRLAAQLKSRGWPRSPEQTPREYAQSVEEPALAAPLARFVEHYERARFGNSSRDAEMLPGLYAEISSAQKR